jgi:hypothetical protein
MAGIAFVGPTAYGTLALCAILLLGREVPGVNVEGLSRTARARRGEHLPVVLSMPDEWVIA